MEDNSTNMRLKQAGKILVRPESWGLELLFAIALYAIGLMLSGKDMIDAIDLAWLTLLNFITSPLALFFMAIGAPIIFWKGVNKVIVNEGAMMAAQSVRDEALRERALQEALSLFRYPALQAKKELLEIRRSRFQQALYKVNESKGLYSTFIDKARSGALSDNRKDQLCAQIQVALSPLCDAKMCLAAVCGTENLQAPDLEICEPIAHVGLMPVEEPKFDIGRNALFFDALDRNAAKISKYLDAITIVFNAQNAEINTLENDIMDEVKRITNG